jgi:hypothetical protein
VLSDRKLWKAMAIGRAAAERLPGFDVDIDGVSVQLPLPLDVPQPLVDERVGHARQDRLATATRAGRRISSPIR